MAVIGQQTLPFPTPDSQAMNPVVSRLFKAVGNKQPVTTNDIVKKGSLIAFGYTFWQHDPYPLLIVTDFIPGQRLRGVNLHYLTFPYIRNLLRVGANNAGFSYGNIRGDSYLVNAFRSYKPQGVQQIKMLDASFILTIMATVRSFDPTQIQTIRKAVQDQIRQEINPKAVPTTVNTTNPAQTNLTGDLNQGISG